jgi:hypothetical protein
MYTESKEETEKSQEAVTPWGGAGPPWPCHRVVWAPRVPSDIALLPIYCLRRENPKRIGINPRKVLQHRRHQKRSSEDRSLCSDTLPGQGIAPGAISIDSPAIFIVVADSHVEEGVVLPETEGSTGSYVVYLSLPLYDLYVIMSFVI